MKSLKQRIVETLRPLAERAFCPTGEGGGIDNSCSPGEGADKKRADAETVGQFEVADWDGHKHPVAHKKFKATYADGKFQHAYRDSEEFQEDEKRSPPLKNIGIGSVSTLQAAKKQIKKELSQKKKWGPATQFVVREIVSTGVPGHADESAFFVYAFGY